MLIHIKADGRGRRVIGRRLSAPGSNVILQDNGNKLTPFLFPPGGKDNLTPSPMAESLSRFCGGLGVGLRRLRA